MRRSVTEILKSILIVVLLCTMLLLMVACLPASQVRQVPWLSRLLQPLAPLLGLPEAELTYMETVLPVMDAASPVAVSVRNGAGRYTAMWDFDRLDEIYDDLGGILGQAMDTASAPETVDAEQLETALAGVSAWFDYEGSLPAGMLAAWLDAEMEIEPDTPISAVVLAVEGEQTALYLLGDTTIRTHTEADPETLDFMLSEYYPDGSSFAFETELPLPRLHLLPGDDLSVSAVYRSGAVTERTLDRVATDLGFNPYGDTNYTDAAGDTYFTEQGGTLQIKRSGRLVLTSTTAHRFTAADNQPNTLAEEARRLVELTAGDTLGDARLYLTEITAQGEETVLTFRHIINGIPVEVAGGPGARVTFTGTAVTKLELQLVTFTVQDQPRHVLPPVQAMALLPEGSELRLIYSDSGDTTVNVGWSQPQT